MMEKQKTPFFSLNTKFIQKKPLKNENKLKTEHFNII